MNHKFDKPAKGLAESFVRWRKNPFLLPVLVAVFGLGLAGQVKTQTFTTLYNFTGKSTSYPYTNSDGANPWGNLVISGNTLYGTAILGGGSGSGTVFSINTDGTGYTVLHTFSGFIDGGGPLGDLILSSNTLYGTTRGGGRFTTGTIFKLNTDGSGFATVYAFSPWNSVNTDGVWPSGSLVLSGNVLYGTASAGGSSGNGTVFAVKTDGSDFVVLHSFTPLMALTEYYTPTNSDGVGPSALILAGNILYGTAGGGGPWDNGTIFTLNTDGTGFTMLYAFTAQSDGNKTVGTNSDGGGPNADLVLSGNTLYGTAEGGGSDARGTVFSVEADGTAFSTLYSFTGGSDGSWPIAGLILSGNTLFGTTMGLAPGSNPRDGAVFAVNIDGSDFVVLHSFTPRDSSTGINSDGGVPQSRLLLSGSTLYGSANGGGTSGSGTLFSISSTPQLAITPAGANVILTWPTTYAGFDYSGYHLQSTTNLGPSSIWASNLPAPVVLNGMNTVTNPVSGSQQFFRLSQ
jgi:uncharacterized repeat protein (TIGR03803 family)